MASRLLRLVLILLLLAGCGVPDADPGLASIDSAAVGLGLRELPRATLRSLGLPYGLAVVKVEAPAKNAGLRMGDVVYGVGQHRIRNIVDFARLLAERPPGVPLTLLVRRGGTDLYLPVDPANQRSTDTLLRT
jgi:S1-C subfamily serine protease